jgi:hypothetical protein
MRSALTQSTKGANESFNLLQLSTENRSEWINRITKLFYHYCLLETSFNILKRNLDIKN